jgi:hypothetical protein
MRKLLPIIFSLIAFSSAHAQAPSPANVGIVRGSPDTFKVLNSHNNWSTFGFVDPTTGIFLPYTNGPIAPNDCIKWGPGLTDAGQGCNSVAGGGSGTNQLTIYTSHSGLVNNVTTPTEAWTVQQQGFYAAGDFGDATYQWNFGSYCPNGTSVTPKAADGLVCVLPIGQDPSTAGRYLLSTNAGINIRDLGFADGGMDNAPIIPSLMGALGHNAGYGGQTVFIPGTPGKPFTAYYFASSFILSAGAEYKCSGITGSNTPGTELVFAPGIHGVVQEDGSVSPDGGWGEGIVEGCTVVSLGLGSGATQQNSNTITAVSMTQDPGGIIPPSTWHVGDGIIATPGGGGYFPPLTITAVFPPGAYITNVGSDGVLTTAPGFAANPVLYGYATATLIEISTYNFSDGDKIQAGNNTYNMVATLGSTPGNILIGADWPTSAANIIAAVNGGSGAGTTYITPTNVPNISAANYNTMTINSVVFTALTLGTAENSYPAVYTPIGGAAAQFPYDTFSGGSTGTVNGFVFYQLPASQKYVVETVAGSPDITITAGPRRPVPGDAIWADFAPWDTRLISVTGTSFPYTAEMNYAFLNTGVQNATVTHDSSSPGQMWVMPFGLKRDTAAKSSGNFFQGWPIGLDMPCSAASPFNCTTSHDSYNMYESDMVGRHTGGDNTGASDSIGEEFADNYVTDWMEGGTVGSVYVNPNSNSYESGTALYGPMGNCYNDNFSLLSGGYVVMSGGACAQGVGLVPSYPGSNWLMVTNQAYDGNGGGPWIFNTPGGASLTDSWNAGTDGSPYCVLLTQSNPSYENFMFGVTPNCSWGDSLTFSLQGAYYLMSFWVYGNYIAFPTNPSSGYYSPVLPEGAITSIYFSIAGLPTCNAGTAGWDESVNNGDDAPVYASIVGAAGSTPQKVWCNGTNWTYR